MSLQLKTTWQHIRRSPYQALAAVMIMVLTFFAAIVFAIVLFGAGKLLMQLESKPQVVVFFNDTVTSEDQVKDLETLAKGTGKVSKMKFVTKEEALKIYQERNKSDPLLLELVSAKTLPASLEIGSATVADLPAIYGVVKDAANVEEISYQQDVVKDLIKIVNLTRQFGVALIGFLLFTSVLIVLIVVGMKIALRKDEIEVQRLIGASKWYIRWPFVAEGIFYGTAGAVIAWVLVGSCAYYLLHFYLGSNGIGNSLVQLTFGNMNMALSAFLIILGASFGSGVFVGSIGSLVAVWRYLKD